jgi:DNA (cytosine-5)-methyltransferase 1
LFAGAGGSTTGAVSVPGVTVAIAANHWQLAIDSHSANHPDTEHVRNNTSKGDGAEMVTPVSEVVRTVTTAGHQSLLAGGPTVDIDDVLFRMLEPHEIAAAQDFPRGYTIKGNKREKVRQIGGAVCPPCARDLVGVVAESLGMALCP